MMRPSQSFDVHIGQMSVVVMGSPGVGKNKDNFVKFTYGLLPICCLQERQASCSLLQQTLFPETPFPPSMISSRLMFRWR